MDCRRPGLWSTAGGLSETQDGGYSRYQRPEARLADTRSGCFQPRSRPWLSATAGYTASLCVDALESVGHNQAGGPGRFLVNRLPPAGVGLGCNRAVGGARLWRCRPRLDRAGDRRISQVTWGDDDNRPSGDGPRRRRPLQKERLERGSSISVGSLNGSSMHLRKPSYGGCGFAGMRIGRRR